jgi:DNA-binding LacI/PurR family transcriptional regulator
VTSDLIEVRAFEEVVLDLVLLGRTRIALIAGPVDDVLASARAAGFAGLLERMHHRVHPDYVVRTAWDEGAGHRSMETLLALPKPPDAVACAGAELAWGALEALAAAGLSWRDVTVAGVRTTTVTPTPVTWPHGLGARARAA